MASTQPRRQRAALKSWIRAHLFLLLAHKMRSQRPQRGPSCCTSAGMLCECDSADSRREGLGSRGGTGPVHWTASVVGVESGSSPRGHGGVGQQEGDGSVPECWVPCGEGNLPGGPQPALPLFRHFPVRRRLVLVSPLLPLEEAELGGRTDRQKWRTDVQKIWMAEKKATIVTIIKFVFTTRISCVLLMFSLTLGGSKASQYRTAQSSLPNLERGFSGHLNCITHSEPIS